VPQRQVDGRCQGHPIGQKKRICRALLLYTGFRVFLSTRGWREEKKNSRSLGQGEQTVGSTRKVEGIKVIVEVTTTRKNQRGKETPIGMCRGRRYYGSGAGGNAKSACCTTSGEREPALCRVSSKPAISTQPPPEAI